jgi:hypothetical protein
MKKNENVIQRTTCFKEHERHHVCCNQNSCKYWIDKDDSLNCVMILASKGPRTLQEIGDIFGVTRMRICQIEKTVIDKLKTSGKINV